MGTAGAIEFCLRGGRRLLVRRGFDRDLLIELIRTLGGDRVIGLPTLSSLDRVGLDAHLAGDGAGGHAVRV